VGRTQLETNSQSGKEWESKVTGTPPPGHSTANQVTLDVATSNGTVRVRADQLIKNESGEFTLVEAKASNTARLTTNQSQAFPILADGGTATVAGKNGAGVGLAAGDTVTFKKVLIVRPDGTQVYQ
jgi:hypothetical protein